MDPLLPDTSVMAPSQSKRGGKIGKTALVCFIALAGACGGWIAYNHFLKENEHLSAAKRHIVAGNFEDAESALRLCLQDQPSNHTAKGLLYYSIRRQVLENQASEGDLEDDRSDLKILNEFLDQQAILRSEDVVKQFKDPAHRSEISAEAKRHRDALKDFFRNERIPFRDWDDFMKSEQVAAAVVFDLKTNSDNEADLRSKDIAAAMLAKNGNDKAGAYLVERSLRDPDVLALGIHAGESVRKHLEKEIKNPDSFLRDDGNMILAYLGLEELVVEFCNAHGPFRPARGKDLPSEQSKLLPDSFWNIRYLPSADKLLLFNAAKAGGFDPAAVRIHFTGDEKNRFLVLSGYSGEKKRFVVKAHALNGDEFKPLKLTNSDNGLLLTEMPAGHLAVWDAERGEFRLGVARFDYVDKTRSESGVRPVTKYRTEIRFNPYLNDGYGGYDSVSIPYTDYENYSKTVGYKELERGALWISYVYNNKAHTAREHRRLWVSDFRTYDAALKEVGDEAKSEPSKVGIQSENIRTGSSNQSSIDGTIERMMGIRVSRAELGRFSSSELRLIRNGIYARKGYAFKDPSLRRYFGNKTWYRPSISDIDAVQSTFTSVQQSNVDLVKEMEGE
jgi:hypothetical protein